MYCANKSSCAQKQVQFWQWRVLKMYDLQIVIKKGHTLLHISYKLSGHHKTVQWQLKLQAEGKGVIHLP
jgi:hypothetical protein